MGHIVAQIYRAAAAALCRTAYLFRMCANRSQGLSFSLSLDGVEDDVALPCVALRSLYGKISWMETKRPKTATTESIAFSGGG